MKILDKIALVVFSVVILIMSILVCTIIFGWIDLTTMYLLTAKLFSDSISCNILIGVSIVFILLAIKAIFFESGEKDSKYNDGVLLENDDGKLLITKETITSMVNAVVSGFESVKTSQAKVYLDNENNLLIILTIEASNNTIIKELSNNLQIRIKEKIKQSLDLDVKSIDIRIKNVVEQSETQP